MPSSETKFSTKYKAEFPFLTSDPKNEFNGMCLTCRCAFSIKTGGRSRINEHIKTKKHNDAVKAVKNCNQLDEFFSDNLTTQAQATAAKELGYTYHVATHGISYNSTNCSSSLFQTLFDKNYRCKSTKTAALVKNVIAPIITSQVKQDIEKMSFITLMTDASNRQDVKLLPVLLRGYLPGKGVLIYKLDIKKIDNERAVTIADVLHESATKWSLVDKIIGFGSDNCPTNFGGPNRNGENNVFSLLHGKLGRTLFGLGCLFHIVGNSVEAATSVLPHDIGAIIESMFKHFHIHAVRVANLQGICDDAELTYKKLTRHSNVRYLTLLSSIQRVTGMHPALKHYFLFSTTDCPSLLKLFFETDYGLFWLLFLEGHLELTTSYILKMEAKEPASFEVASFAQDLLNKLKDRKAAVFIPFKAQSEFHMLTEQRQYRVKQFIKSFYKTEVQYLERWMSSSDGTEIFSWCSLTGKLEWTQISNSLDFIYQKLGMHVFEKINRDGVFDEFNSIKQLVENNLTKWIGKTTIMRWEDIWAYADENGLSIVNFKLVVELILCLPGTNAQNERLFSIIFNTWSDERGQCSEETLDAITTIKFNSKQTCQEFYEMIRDDKKILRSVISTEKYN